MKLRPAPTLPALGWREWVSLSELGMPAIKAKIDTGARSSTLHAFDVDQFERDGIPWVRFKVHPVQRSARESLEAEAPLHDQRLVRDSGGKEQLRPVILTTVEVNGRAWRIELTLTNRDAMGFRMLLGRQAIRGRFVVDAGRSYLQGRRNGQRKQVPSGENASRKDPNKEGTKS